MKNFARWTMFTVATTLVWLVGGFLYLVLSRLYAGLQLPTLMLFALVVLGAATALAAINFAAKLDEEQDPEQAATTVRRARPKIPSLPGR
jgi:hypothetical protein